jgi:glycosyltransferase involved in cell wall biosynthesis
METRIVTAIEIAESAGYSVSVRTARPLVPGSRTQRLLAGHDVRSVLEDWSRRPGIRLARGAAQGALMARRRRRLTDEERAGVGHRWSMAEIEQYWRGPGRELLDATDVLHLFGSPGPFLLDALAAAAALGVPSLYQSVHSVTADYAADAWRSGFVESCNDLDLILVSHPRQADDFREHFAYRGPTLEIGQWAYGIEEELLDIDRRAATDGPIVIGALCRLDPVKDLDSLIRAVAALPAAAASVQLRIGGDGPQEDELRQLCAELGVADRVHFSGYVEDRVGFYGSIDVFAITSLAEGGPVTGVEAMAAGLPIVSTAVGAMPERLRGDAGILVDPGDVAGIAAALAALADDPAARQTLGATARARYLDELASAQQRRRLIGGWTELARRRRTARSEPTSSPVD